MSLSFSSASTMKSAKSMRRVRLLARTPRYLAIIDFGGRGAVIGSACLSTTFQAPSSRRKTVVTRTATGRRRS
jgi:hypothetical protein